MKTWLCAAAAASAIILGAQAAMAQAAPSYEFGPVWAISRVEVKPGMFDAYMAYLSGAYRAMQEAGKKRGDILDYKVLTLPWPGDHEPDVILMVEFKNMGVFDRSRADMDAQQAAAFGSVAKATQSQVDREAMRTLRGVTITREVILAK